MLYLILWPKVSIKLHLWLKCKPFSHYSFASCQLPSYPSIIHYHIHQHLPLLPKHSPYTHCLQGHSFYCHFSWGNARSTPQMANRWELFLNLWRASIVLFMSQPSLSQVTQQQDFDTQGRKRNMREWYFCRVLTRSAWLYNLNHMWLQWTCCTIFCLNIFTSPYSDWGF